MRVLTVDIGNTAVKGSVFENKTFLESTIAENHDVEELRPLIEKYSPQGVICCSVGRDSEAFIWELEKLTGKKVVSLSHSTPLPISIDYATPETLGLDRIAAAAGAAVTAERAFVVDAGTAMTLDVITNGVFRGGNISPGLRLRFRSLNKFTSRLPLVNPAGEIPEFGFNTETAIRSGVVGGIIDEIHNRWQRASENNHGMRLLLTGGDAPFLAPLLRRRGLSPEIMPTLVGLGLEEIYKYTLTAEITSD